MCHTKSVFITLVMGANGGREFATVNAPGAYLRAPAAEEMIMLLEDGLVELMVLVDPKLYREFVTIGGNGTPRLYVHMNKALYGLLESVLQWYKKL